MTHVNIFFLRNFSNRQKIIDIKKKTDISQFPVLQIIKDN